MYEAQLPTDWTYILNDSGCCALFCATQDIYNRVQTEVLPSTPAVHAILCLDAAHGEPHAFATAMSMVGDGDQEGTLITPPTPEDLADLIYTSGTTGQPKGDSENCGHTMNGSKHALFTYSHVNSFSYRCGAYSRKFFL